MPNTAATNLMAAKSISTGMMRDQSSARRNTRQTIQTSSTVARKSATTVELWHRTSSKQYTATRGRPGLKEKALSRAISRGFADHFGDSPSALDLRASATPAEIN